MPAYVIVEIDVRDPKGYEEYKRLAGPAVEAFGGSYLARGGEAETLEGDWQPKRVVLLRFESVARAKEWWHSKAYDHAKKVRYHTASSKMIVVEGI